jgi:hypothetical protein
MSNNKFKNKNEKEVYNTLALMVKLRTIIHSKFNSEANFINKLNICCYDFFELFQFSPFVNISDESKYILKINKNGLQRIIDYCPFCGNKLNNYDLLDKSLYRDIKKIIKHDENY